MVLLALVLVILNTTYFFWYRDSATTAVSGSWFFDFKKRYLVLDSESAAAKKCATDIGKDALALDVDGHEIFAAIARLVKEEDGAEWARQRELYAEQYKAKHEKDAKEVVKQQLDQKASDTNLAFFKEVKAQFLRDNDEKLRKAVLEEIFREYPTIESLKKHVGDPDSVRRQYWEKVMVDVIKGTKPNCRDLKEIQGPGIGGHYVRDVGSPLYSEEFLRKDRLPITDEIFNEIQRAHDEVVKRIRALDPPSSVIFQGRGIVIPATKKFIHGAAVIITQIREMGSQLPVEVVLDSEGDYSKQACEEIFPKLNAKCLVIERVLGKPVYDTLKIGGFQMKVVAIALSSFDETLVLDSDNFPVQNVDTLFETVPFQETKFVVWPDAWHKGCSPVYYDMARYDVGEVVGRSGIGNDKDYSEYLKQDPYKGVQYHDRAGLPPFRGVESGQILLSKSDHWRSLYLSLYYNFYGPEHYYTLLYLGTYGTGDRETFVPALHVMKEPYYFVDWELSFAGLEVAKQGGDGTSFVESTMVQKDVQLSYEFAHKWRKWLRKNNIDSRIYAFQSGGFTKDLREKMLKETESKPAGPLFLHVHNPKISAVYNELTTKLKNHYDRRHIRAIGQMEDVLGSTDWELKFQAINEWVTCTVLTDEELWKSLNLDRAKVCELVKNYVEFLKKDSNDLGAEKLKLKQDLKF